MTRIVGPVSERDDLVQQVFIDLHRALATFRGEARFSTFCIASPSTSRVITSRACAASAA